MGAVRRLALVFSLALSPALGASTNDAWSIAQVGDVHAPAFSQMATSTNWAPFVLAHTNDGVFNFVGVILAGDIFQQDDQSAAGAYTRQALTNDINLLKSNGLFVVLANGNHDCDYFHYSGNTNGLTSVASCWANRAMDTNVAWNKIFPLTFYTNQVGFVSNRVSGESECIAFTYTNGVEKLLIATYKTLATNCNPAVDYAAQTDWIVGMANNIYSDHKVMVLAHFFLNGYGEMRYTDGPNVSAGSHVFPDEQSIGPGRQPLDGGILGIPKLLLMIGGHDRTGRKDHQMVKADDGHLVDIVLWNTQGHTNNCGLMNVYTFKPRRGYVELNTYDVINQRFMTNGDAALINSLGLACPHNWKVPFPGVTRALTLQ